MEVEVLFLQLPNTAKQLLVTLYKTLILSYEKHLEFLAFIYFVVFKVNFFDVSFLSFLKGVIVTTDEGDIQLLVIERVDTCLSFWGVASLVLFEHGPSSSMFSIILILNWRIDQGLLPTYFWKRHCIVAGQINGQAFRCSDLLVLGRDVEDMSLIIKEFLFVVESKFVVERIAVFYKLTFLILFEKRLSV